MKEIFSNIYFPYVDPLFWSVELFSITTGLSSHGKDIVRQNRPWGVSQQEGGCSREHRPRAAVRLLQHLSRSCPGAEPSSKVIRKPQGVIQRGHLLLCFVCFSAEQGKQSAKRSSEVQTCERFISEAQVMASVLFPACEHRLPALLPLYRH